MRRKSEENKLTRPSKIPVPSVATLGATYHSLSLSLVSWSCWVTSSGLKSGAIGQLDRDTSVGDNRARTAGNILLVGKHQQESILHFAIIDDLVKLRASLLHTGSVTGVDDEDQALCAGVVVSPQRADLVLTANIPYIEFHVLVGDALDVKADGGNGGDILVAQFQFVENRWQTLLASLAIECSAKIPYWSFQQHPNPA